MVPIIQVSIDGRDVSSGVAARILEGEVVQHDGGHGDECHLLISNFDGRLAKPARGGLIDVRVGFAATGVRSLGQFKVQEIAKHGPKAHFSVVGHGVDLITSLKAQHTRVWNQTTLGAILGTLAGENGLTLAIDGKLGATAVTTLAQTHESDMHLITRLARHYGAIGKPMGGRLLFIPKGAGTSASGATLPPIVVTPNDLEGSFTISTSDRPKRGKVVAHHFDRGTGKREQVSHDTGDGGPDYHLPHMYGDAASAQAACAARATDFKAAKGTFKGTLKSGDNQMQAGGVLTSQGFGDDDDHDWIIKRVPHRFGDHGYVTGFDAEVKR
ncbi:MAG: hypothetical protein KGQ46_12540 [Hyphomicrobiales bacterium]|nr:hypothetical protein [Hyphomicrobiales bacterium]MDE2113811.1 hypothetical protein [Hyphomicrobiales bacterium]